MSNFIRVNSELAISKGNLVWECWNTFNVVNVFYISIELEKYGIKIEYVKENTFKFQNEVDENFAITTFYSNGKLNIPQTVIDDIKAQDKFFNITPYSSKNSIMEKIFKFFGFSKKTA